MHRRQRFHRLQGQTHHYPLWWCLRGITRDTAISIANELGLTLETQPSPAMTSGVPMDISSPARLPRSSCGGSRWRTIGDGKPGCTTKPSSTPSTKVCRWHDAVTIRNNKLDWPESCFAPRNIKRHPKQTPTHRKIWPRILNATTAIARRPSTSPPSSITRSTKSTSAKIAPRRKASPQPRHFAH